MSETNTSKPSAKYQAGKVSTAIFENKHTRQDGTPFTKITIKSPQSFYEKDGKLHNTSDLTVDEALRARHVLDQAISKAIELEGPAKKANHAARVNSGRDNGAQNSVG